VDALLDAAAADGAIVRTATTVRLAEHRVSLEDRADDVDRLLAALSGERLALPPTVKELLADGFAADVVDAAARAGRVVRIAPELVVAPELVDRALAAVRTHAEAGLTVSALRETLGTSRKYAVPLAEWMDREGLTRRDGDLRFPA
jgi:selenocysteine-specific elongation factor